LLCTLSSIGILLLVLTILEVAVVWVCLVVGSECLVDCSGSLKRVLIVFNDEVMMRLWRRYAIPHHL